MLAGALALAGCSFGGLTDGERVDYRSGAAKTNPLEVPPDLAQLTKEGRYPSQRGVVSASALPPAGMTRTSAPPSNRVAPVALGDFKVERDGDQRWLIVPKRARAGVDADRQFLAGHGLHTGEERPGHGRDGNQLGREPRQAAAGHDPQGPGTVLDSAYSTGEMDQYRTRVERTASGSEIFIRHGHGRGAHLAAEGQHAMGIAAARSADGGRNAVAAARQAGGDRNRGPQCGRQPAKR